MGCKLERHFLTLTRLWRVQGHTHSISTSSPLTTSTRGPHPFVSEADKKGLLTKKGDKPWKNAASLIIAAPNPVDKDKTDFLVMKRSTGSSFAPNTLCFPGGVASPADSDKGWADFFKLTTQSELSEISFLHNAAPQPPLYLKESFADDFKDFEDVRSWYRDKVPPSVALRIAAVRETFEECGILLVRENLVEEASKKVGRDGALGMGNVAGTFVIEDPEEVEKWQIKIRNNPSEFLILCKELCVRPDLNALVEWSNWLTPNSFGAKRYDTIFYMAVVPNPLPFLSDAYEVATIRWTSAERVMQGAQDGKARVIPPQIYELERLRDTNVDKIMQLMRMRLRLGIERTCPCYIKVNDGIISVFPGDDLYPHDYKIYKFEEIRELEQSLEQVRKSTKHHHRIEFKSEFEFELVINVGPRLGQVYLK